MTWISHVSAHISASIVMSANWFVNKGQSNPVKTICFYVSVLSPTGVRMRISILSHNLPLSEADTNERQINLNVASCLTPYVSHIAFAYLIAACIRADRISIGYHVCDPNKQRYNLQIIGMGIGINVTRYVIIPCKSAYW